MQAQQDKPKAQPITSHRYVTRNAYPLCELVAARKENTVTFEAKEVELGGEAGCHHKVSMAKLSLKIQFEHHPNFPDEFTALFTFIFERGYDDKGRGQTFMLRGQEAKHMFCALTLETSNGLALRNTFNNAAQHLTEHLASVLRNRSTPFMGGQEIVPLLVEAIYLNDKLKYAFLCSSNLRE